MWRACWLTAGIVALAPAVARPATAERRYDWQLLDQVKREKVQCAAARDADPDESTAGMRHACVVYGQCVEQLIARLGKEFYAADAFGPGGIAARIEAMRVPYGKTYWTIYNEAGPCGDGGCGTMYQPAHAAKWDDLMDQLFDDMIGHLGEYRPDEPRRIRFSKGQTATVLQGRFEPDADRGNLSYVLGAKAGQLLELRLTGAYPAVGLLVFCPGGGKSAFMREGNFRLPRSGDYVVRIGAAAGGSGPPPAFSYSLAVKVTAKAPPAVTAGSGLGGLCVDPQP